MKNLNSIISSLVICLFLASGCSQQRYSHVNKVRVDQEAKAPERKSAPVIQAETPAEPVVQEVAIVSEPVAPQTATVVEENPQPMGVIGHTFMNTKRMAKNVQPVISRVEKKISKIQPDVTEDLDGKYSSGLRLIIIGLILVLIAIIISVVVPFPLGWLIYTIGAVLIVIGIIIWLLEWL